MMQLRNAVAARAEVGKPLLGDFDDAVAKLTLDELADLRAATIGPWSARLERRGRR